MREGDRTLSDVLDAVAAHFEISRTTSSYRAKMLKVALAIGIVGGKVVGFGPTYALKVELNFKESAVGK